MKIKNWYQSKTIWGVIMAAIGYFLTVHLGVEGITVPENGDFANLQQYVGEIKETKNSWPSLFGTLISMSGFVLAFIGRIKADTEIKLGGIKPNHTEENA